MTVGDDIAAVNQGAGSPEPAFGMRRCQSMWGVEIDAESTLPMAPRAGW
jgi:hypothetical protein